MESGVSNEAQGTRRAYFVLRAALLAAPPLFLIAVYVRYSLDFPRLDQWEFIPFLDKAYTGGVGLVDFWSQHNEHRLAVPRAVMLGLAYCTGWNIHYELAANLLFGSLLALAVGGWIRLHAPGPASRYLLAPVATLLFSVAQWQNWFLGWQMQEFMNVLFAVLCFMLLAREKLRIHAVLLAALLALLATYSFANGLLVWPVGVVVLLWPKRRPATHIAVWAVLGALVSASYLYGYESPSYHPSFASGLAHPRALLRYVLQYLGQPLSPFSDAGAALLGCMGLVAWTRQASGAYSRPSPVAKACVAFGLYAIGSALVTGMARVELGGPAQAMSSRYVTMANLLWVAVLVSFFVSLTARWRTAGALRLGLVSVLTCLCLWAASFYGAYKWTERYNAIYPAREALLAGEEDPALRFVHPDTGMLIERREILIRHGLSIFGRGAGNRE